MGVDYTAFAVYGQRIKAPPGVDAHELDVNDILEVFEYGSRFYGGEFGYILGVRSSYESVDIGHGGTLCEPLNDQPFGGLEFVLEQECKRLGLTAIDKQPSWFVCGWIS